MAGKIGDAIGQADTHEQLDSTSRHYVLQCALAIYSRSAVHKHLETRRGRDIEGLVAEQVYGPTPGLQPALPTARRDQLDFFTTGRDFDFEGVLNIQHEIQGQIAVGGQHQIAHVEVTSRTDAIVQIAGVQP
ncbi:hypothetical protein D3C87_1378010 [compost metagenome]